MNLYSRLPARSVKSHIFRGRDIILQLESKTLIFFSSATSGVCVCARKDCLVRHQAPSRKAASSRGREREQDFELLPSILVSSVRECRKVGSDRLSPFMQVLRQGSDSEKLTGARLVGHRSLSVHPCRECCRTSSCYRCLDRQSSIEIAP